MERAAIARARFIAHLGDDLIAEVEARDERVNPVIRKFELLHALVDPPLRGRLGIERSSTNNLVGVRAISDDSQRLHLPLLAPQPRSTLKGTFDGDDDEPSNDVLLEAVVDQAPTRPDNCLTRTRSVTAVAFQSSRAL